MDQVPADLEDTDQDDFEDSEEDTEDTDEFDEDSEDEDSEDEDSEDDLGDDDEDLDDDEEDIDLDDDLDLEDSDSRDPTTPTMTTLTPRPTQGYLRALSGSTVARPSNARAGGARRAGRQARRSTWTERSRPSARSLCRAEVDKRPCTRPSVNRVADVAPVPGREAV